MKKALALVLALVMVLSLAVSASAVTLVKLGEVKEADKVVVHYADDIFTALNDTKHEYWCYDPFGGTFYITLNENGHKLENIEVATTGIVSAKVMEWDPETMVLENNDGSVAVDYDIFYKVVKKEGGKEKVVEEMLSYDKAKEAAKGYNTAEKTSKYQVVPYYYVYVIEITVAPNFSAAYKEGSFKIKAYDTVTKKNLVSATYTVISDVSIFDYETVKWAAEYHDEIDNPSSLTVFADQGYSDYFTAKFGYGTPDLITMPGAEVVSTTAFRAIQGKNLMVNVLGDNLTVDIKAIAAGQKGVNFDPYVEICGVDCKDFVRDGGIWTMWENLLSFNKAKRTMKFGFYGDQTIASDYTITLSTGLTYFQLREFFLEKVEEDDIITFYILKDGKKFDEFTVDYMTADYNDEVELIINGKAGTNLGKYEITLAAPAAEKGEQNPNTGAESMIGVVAALAVVSVATAAAVSLKK